MYQQLFDRLSLEGIRAPHDVAAIKPDFRRAGGYLYLTARTYPWVEDIFRIIAAHYDTMIDGYKSTARRPTLVATPYGDFGSHSWTPLDPIFDIRARYGCILPGTCLFLSHQIGASGDQESGPVRGTAAIPEDFLLSLFALKPLLLNDLAILLPRRIAWEPVGFPGVHGTTAIYYLERRDDSIVIKDEGRAAEDLKKSLAEAVPSGIDGPGILLAEMPWLLNARLDDFVELVKENPEEFELHRNLLLEAVSAVEKPDEVLPSIVRDLHRASLRIDVLQKNKHRELAQKGLDVAVGTLLTVGTLVFPEASVLTPFVGGKTAWEGFRVLRDRKDVSKTLGSEQGWLLWATKQKTAR